MNVLSLFDGISAGHQALERAGIKIDKYLSSEIDQYAIAITQYNYPDTVQLGDITTIRYEDGVLYSENYPDGIVVDIDMVIGGSPCFVGGTMILTDRGYKDIKEVSPGDFVLSHTGKWRRVLRIGNKMNTETRVISGYGNIGIETTDSHPFYTRTMFRGKGKRLFGDPQWTEAKQIDKSHYCSMVRHQFGLKSPQKRSSQFWYMIGRYTGDGWYRKSKRKSGKTVIYISLLYAAGNTSLMI